MSTIFIRIVKFKLIYKVLVLMLNVQQQVIQTFVNSLPPM